MSLHLVLSLAYTKSAQHSDAHLNIDAGFKVEVTEPRILLCLAPANFRALAAELLLRHTGVSILVQVCEQAVRQVRVLRDKAPAELAAQLASWRPNLLYLCAGAGPGGTLLPLRLGLAGQPGGVPSSAGSGDAALTEAAPSALKEEAAANGNRAASVNGSAGVGGGGHDAPASDDAPADGAPGAAHVGPRDMDVEGVGSAFRPALHGCALSFQRAALSPSGSAFSSLVLPPEQGHAGADLPSCLQGLRLN